MDVKDPMVSFMKWRRAIAGSLKKLQVLVLNYVRHYISNTTVHHSQWCYPASAFCCIQKKKRDYIMNWASFIFLEGMLSWLFQGIFFHLEIIYMQAQDSWQWVWTRKRAVWQKLDAISKGMNKESKEEGREGEGKKHCYSSHVSQSAEPDWGPIHTFT